MKTTYIYALIDPATREVRYVGKTVAPKQRLSYHIYAARILRARTYAASWIRGLLAQALVPEMQILEECSDETWRDRERFWIRKYKCDARLTNLTDGGDGMTGWNPSDETRAKWSIANSHRTLSAEARRNMSEAAKKRGASWRLGQRHTEQTRKRISEKVSASLLGNQRCSGNSLSQAVRDKISNKLKGRIFSDTHRTNHAEAMASAEVREKLSVARRRHLIGNPVK